MVERKSYSLSKPWQVLILSWILIGMLVVGVSLSFLEIQNYRAEAKYTQGINHLQQNNLDQSIDHLDRATDLNSNLDLYYRDLAQAYFFKLESLLREGDIAQNREQASQLIKNSIDMAKQATDINPYSIANWNVRGFIYRNLIVYLKDANEWAIKSYERSRGLNPNSPFILTEIGRIHVIKANLLGPQDNETEKQKLLDTALDKFRKALELKPDYSPAQFQISVVYDLQGKTDEAIAELENLKQTAPNDPRLAFQLGALYWEKEEYSKAQTELERAIELSPNYSNARYFLGLVYDKQGRKDEAIKQFEKVAELNPENQEIKTILANLEAGKAALEGITIPSPPVEETPEEIRE